jgi:hypothetical protein
MRTDTHRSDHRYDHRSDRRPDRRQGRADPTSIWPQPNVPAMPANPEIYWGWSPENQRMEMMDLSRFVEAYLSGYQQAMDQLRGAAPGAVETMSPAAWSGRPRREEQRYGHQHHRHDHHDCGCGHHHHGCDHDHDQWHDHDDWHDHGHCEHRRGCGDHDCHCECCISDEADVVVYARCGEVRRVPIEVENDTRRDREGVTFAVSDVHSAGGRQLAWKVALDPSGPQTLEACSRTVIDLVVAIRCDDADTGDDKSDEQPASTGTRAKKAAAKEAAAEDARTSDTGRADVDDCQVGYVTVRAEGCLIRPIVVAIAVVPRRCDAYHAGCSCSCCC